MFLIYFLIILFFRLERQREVSIPCPVYSASLHQNKEVCSIFLFS